MSRAITATQELTTALRAVESGDPRGPSELLPLVYRELRQLAVRRLANEAPGNTLQATALVHEAYMRLVDSSTSWSGRAHFFAAAARAMRHILIDRARARHTQKRGGDRRREAESIADVLPARGRPDDDLLALDEALTRLETRDPRKAQIVMLRYFAGLSLTDVAAALDLSTTTVKDEWAFARAWLQSELGNE